MIFCASRDIRYGTPGSLLIFSQSTSNKDRIIALLKLGLHAHDETVVFLSRRVQVFFLPVPFSSEMGHLRLSSSVFDGQASNLHKR